MVAMMPQMLLTEDFDSPNLTDPELTGIDLEELVRLYDLTDWRVILLDDLIDREYGGIRTVSIFKALALPYLIPITSERALGRAIIELEPLQNLCGFSQEHLPGERTLWHFRNKYWDVYPELMLHVLIAIVLSGKSPNMNLPFVTPLKKEEGRLLSGHTFTLSLDDYRPAIEVVTAINEPMNNALGSFEDYRQWERKWKEEFRRCEQWDELKAKLGRYERERQRFNRRMLAEEQDKDIGRSGELLRELHLPVNVRTALMNGKEIHFLIDYPVWHSYPSERYLILKSTSSPARKPYYRACNVLVIRQKGNRKEILLSKRKDEGYGMGRFTLPGGKKKPGEELEQCSVRELREETGIELVKSRPVSLFNRRIPDKEVLSVGVLAEEFEGEPRTLEPDQHEGWQWYDLHELPSPLFEPARVAIEQYLEEKYPGLQWSDVESQVPRQPPLSI